MWVPVSNAKAVQPGGELTSSDSGQRAVRFLGMTGSLATTGGMHWNNSWLPPRSSASFKMTRHDWSIARLQGDSTTVTGTGNTIW